MNTDTRVEQVLAALTPVETTHVSPENVAAVLRVLDALEAKPRSPVTLAVIGHKHFGNPIPQAWYSAAKELLASGHCEPLEAKPSGAVPLPESDALWFHPRGHCSEPAIRESKVRAYGDAREAAAVSLNPWDAVGDGHRAAVTTLAAKSNMTEAQVLRAAIRLYQADAAGNVARVQGCADRPFVAAVSQVGEPFGWFHELLDHEGKGNGVFLGVTGPDAKSVCEKSHTDGETSPHRFPLYSAAPVADDVARWDGQQIADACVMAEIQDSKFESLMLALDRVPITVAPADDVARDAGRYRHVRFCALAFPADEDKFVVRIDRPHQNKSEAGYFDDAVDAAMATDAKAGE